MLMGEVRAERLMRAIPPEVRDGLSAEQAAAIREAARRNRWDRHPVDVRISLPTPFGRYYLTLVGGRERRNEARLAHDRAQHPFATLGNIAFFAGATVLFGFGLLGLFAALIIFAL